MNQDFSDFKSTPFKKALSSIFLHKDDISIAGSDTHIKCPTFEKENLMSDFRRKKSLEHESLSSFNEFPDKIIENPEKRTYITKIAKPSQNPFFLALNSCSNNSKNTLKNLSKNSINSSRNSPVYQGNDSSNIGQKSIFEQFAVKPDKKKSFYDVITNFYLTKKFLMI